MLRNWRRTARVRWSGAGCFAALCSCGTTACGGLASNDARSGEPFGELSRAVASLSFGTPDGACPGYVEYAVPSSDAHDTVETGQGERAIDGRDGDIRCRVASLADPDRGFAVDLRYREGGRGEGELRVRGELRGGRAAGRVTVQMNGPSFAIEAECRAEVREVLSGAIWLRTAECTHVSYDDELADCDIDLGMIFENCSEE
jgi:hypothetical protein